MKPLNKAIMGPLKKFYCKKIEKKLRSNIGRGVIFYHISEQFGNAYKRVAKGEIESNGLRATSVIPCDKIIFRPHDFPLATEDTVAAPANHLALMKTSDINHHSVLLIFRRSLLLRLFEHQIPALCQA